MLAIRMQRTGRKGHTQFRVVVQDSRFSPTSGRVVEYLGSYDPHTKTNTLNKEKATAYLSNGARPSERVVRLLTAEGVKLPAWVEKPAKKEKAIRNVEKLRRNRPAEPEAEVESPAEVEEAATPAETETPPEEATPVAEEPAAQPDAESEAPAETAEQPATPAEEPKPKA
jgi:small subunit ribosomal protein S16